ncbi:hypothetical protein [Frankia sp. AgB32]|uniref:hypothetical protein n=1 Tax=Frankia sp. AgB32 TaxID=631119 RepID=UPI002010AB20|nr:hypothetical protein [Frankia sp. AgB32]MCK9894723.1 hypothetical protein [Frankia sp. AgB32]
MSRDVRGFLLGVALLLVAVMPTVLYVVLLTAHPERRAVPVRPAPAVDWQSGFWGDVHPAVRDGARTPLGRGVPGGR